MKDTRLSWGSFRVGKKWRKVWRVGLSSLLWMVWNSRNKIAFRNDVLCTQKLKTAFVSRLWSETKLSIEDGPPSLVPLID